MSETAQARSKPVAEAAGGFEWRGGVLSCGIRAAPNGISRSETRGGQTVGGDRAGVDVQEHGIRYDKDGLSMSLSNVSWE